VSKKPQGDSEHLM